MELFKSQARATDTSVAVELESMLLSVLLLKFAMQLVFAKSLAAGFLQGLAVVPISTTNPECSLVLAH